MTTTFVGMKEFRQNMAKISADACKRMSRLVVLRKNKPMFSVVPLSERERFEDELMLDLKSAKADLAAGRTVTLDQIEKKLGLLRKAIARSVL